MPRYIIMRVGKVNKRARYGRDSAEKKEKTMTIRYCKIPIPKSILAVSFKPSTIGIVLKPAFLSPSKSRMSIIAEPAKESNE